MTMTTEQLYELHEQETCRKTNEEMLAIANELNARRHEFHRIFYENDENEGLPFSEECIDSCDLEEYIEQMNEMIVLLNQYYDFEKFEKIDVKELVKKLDKVWKDTIQPYIDKWEGRDALTDEEGEEEIEDRVEVGKAYEEITMSLACDVAEDGCNCINCRVHSIVRAIRRECIPFKERKAYAQDHAPDVYDDDYDEEEY